MSIQPYGIDQKILRYGELPTRKRGLDDCYVGQGTPIFISFPNDWTVNTNSGISIKLYNGNIIAGPSGSGGGQIPYVTRPFSTENGSVTLSFTLLFATEFSEFNMLFTGKIPEVWWLSIGPAGWFLNNGDPSENNIIGRTNMKVGQTSRIVIILGQGGIKIWENDELVVNYEDSTPQEFYFGVSPTSTIQIGEVIKAIVGPVGRIRMRRDASRPETSSTTNSISNNIDSISTLISAVSDISSPVENLLANVDVSVWDLMWGKNPNQELLSQAQAFVVDPKMIALREALRALNVIGAHGSTFYIGHYGSGSVIISGKYSLGFYIDVPPNGPVKAIFSFTPGIGLTTNAGFSTGLEFGFYTGLAKDYLGWGWNFGFDISFEHVFNFSFGGGGSVPYNSENERVGLFTDLGMGLSALDIDVNGGISYTWEL